MTQLALIGVGRWGQNIARTLTTDIGGVTVRTATTANETRKLFAENLAGVLIATPGSTHADVALPFIERGIPTFIEKPFTTSLPSAERLALAARKHRTPVMVGHIHLYNSAYLKAKQLTKTAGKIRALYLEGMNNGPIRDDMSALWDWSPHDVAMALDVIGRPPKSVQAWGLKTLRPATLLYDMVQIRLTFPGGAVAHIANGWLSPEKRKCMTVVGQKHAVVYNDVAPDKKVSLYKNFGPHVRGKKASEQQPTISHPSYHAGSPLEAELRAFLRMVRTNKEPVTDLTHALHVMRVLDATERSMQLDGAAIEI